METSQSLKLSGDETVQHHCGVHDGPDAVAFKWSTLLEDGKCLDIQLFPPASVHVLNHAWGNYIMSLRNLSRLQYWTDVWSHFMWIDFTLKGFLSVGLMASDEPISFGFVRRQTAKQSDVKAPQSTPEIILWNVTSSSVRRWCCSRLLSVPPFQNNCIGEITSAGFSFLNSQQWRHVCNDFLWGLESYSCLILGSFLQPFYYLFV